MNCASTIHKFPLELALGNSSKDQINQIKPSNAFGL